MDYLLGRGRRRVLCWINRQGLASSQDSATVCGCFVYLENDLSHLALQRVRAQTSHRLDGSL
jgi:hypothetical protein